MTGEDRAAQAARLRQLLATQPGDAVAWHNLAAAEGDLGHARPAEEAARRALALGIPAPETRLVLARALLDQGKLDEAERTFVEAIALRPAYADAHRDLAQLRWMRSADRSVALEALEQALAREPQAPLFLVRSIALEYTGDAAAALAAAEQGLRRSPADLQLLAQAAHLHCLLGDAEAGLGPARRAAALAPGDPGLQIILCEALLGAGRAGEAEAVAAALASAHPLDQHALALLATAWRLLGDARYRQVMDYGALVSSRRLETPTGWTTLEAFLADVRAELEALHRFAAHPFQQSVRGGSQLPLNEQEAMRPLVRALLAALQRGADDHLSRLGRAADPFRARNTGAMRITGAWSVRLASGGFHTDHVHQRGWLSGVCYLRIPPEATADLSSRAGWLRLGHPGIRTRPQLPAECYVKPEPGLLVLFPAYMWHGVEPFESPAQRLSVAFDALPA